MNGHLAPLFYLNDPQQSLGEVTSSHLSALLVSFGRLNDRVKDYGDLELSRELTRRYGPLIELERFLDDLILDAEEITVEKD